MELPECSRLEYFIGGYYESKTTASVSLTSLVHPQHVETGHGFEWIGGHKRKPLSNSGDHAKQNRWKFQSEMILNFELTPLLSANQELRNQTDFHFIQTLSHTLLYSLTHTTIFSCINNYTLSHTLLYSLTYTTILSQIPNYILSHTLLYSHIHY